MRLVQSSIAFDIFVKSGGGPESPHAVAKTINATANPNSFVIIRCTGDDYMRIGPLGSRYCEAAILLRALPAWNQVICSSV